MFQTMFLDVRVPLTPAEINIVSSPESIQSMLETKLREMHEGKCNANGFVKPGSVKLLARSMGAAENGRFTSNLLFDCKLSCEVLYPTAGSVIRANIIKVNRMGAYAIFEDAIRILLPRDLHIGSEAFDVIKEGDTVEVSIDRSRFQTNDSFIMAVGRLVSSEEDRAV
jgi:DNA-directed RNA polymerase subunit E'/Rpb7